MNKKNLRRRALAWLLSLVCVLGLLPPADVFAADDAPDSITLLKADYNTGASSGGLETYVAPNKRSGVRFWRTPLLSFNWWRLAGSNR